MRSKRGTSAFILCLLAPAWFCSMSLALAAAENYALIVAASDYPNLDKKFWLAGPANDAVLVRDYLTSSAPVPFRPENVVTLGSGEGLQLATHEAILAQLATLASKSRPGDFVFLQFSGHGSQQPARDDTNEPDGRDEIFLAADARLAEPGSPFLPNVLTDDELGAALDAIRASGAFVWLVFDSCYSGTMTRGAPEEAGMTDRDIDPRDLGLPDSAFRDVVVSEAGRALPFAIEENTTSGGLVAFFAAQSTETTPERPYEVVDATGATVRQNYGVFTHTIFSMLAKNPSVTYRQLAQSVLADYAAANVLKPTPLFSGDLDTPVFGSTEVAAAAQWPTVKAADGALSISAGTLHGLSAGTKLLVLPNPASPNVEALGMVEVVRSELLRSTLRAVAGSGSQRDLNAVPVGAYVRLVEAAYPFELVVARPEEGSMSTEMRRAVETALSAVASDTEAPLRIRVVDAGQSADVRLAVLSETEVQALGRNSVRDGGSASSVDASSLSSEPLLWLLPRNAELSLDPAYRAATLSLTAADRSTLAASLSDTLIKVYRATGLSRLSQASTFKPTDFALEFSRQAAGSTKLEILASESTPIVRPDDRLFVNFKNNAGKAVDLNLLYVDRDYGITLLCQAHLAKGDRLFQPIADLNDSDRGAERIVAVVNESGKDLTDLGFLTQTGIRPPTRGLADQSLLGMLEDLGAGEPTRGPIPSATRDPKVPRGAVVIVPLEVSAASGAQPASEMPLQNAEPFVGSCESE